MISVIVELNIKFFKFFISTINIFKILRTKLKIISMRRNEFYTSHIY